ncbi:WD40 repeat domain-containing protein [Dactylosporangium sp. NPDC051485]|uniref:WD40 repeat domain-containing protein n=1 Tax=Dactylosporangium sp. NPDC051485 TaxID=3154846 RepID=UPI0034374C7A
MTTDHRLRAAVHELVEAIPVPAVAPPAMPLTSRRSWRPLVVAAAVVVLLLAVGLVRLPAAPSAPAAGPATLPRVFADHSYLTANVSAAPAGPAIAIYGYGQGDMPYQTPQLIAVGMDGRTYREIDIASKRGRPAEADALKSPPAPALLSPDGSRVAVADDRGPANDVAIVDLTTGRTRSHPVPAGSAVQLLAWSPDSMRLAYAVAPYRADGHGDPRPALAADGELTLLDLATGGTSTVAGQRGVLDAAFSPDGRTLAVQVGPELRLLNDGGGSTVVALPAGHRLGGPAAWSPDGSRLALFRVAMGSPSSAAGYWAPAGLAVLDLPTGRSAPIDTYATEILGWQGADLLASDSLTIVSVPPTGPARLLARFQPGDDHWINAVQLATARTGDLQVRDTGVDRGPWPWWLRVLTAGGLLLAGGVVFMALRRRRARRS